MTKYQITNKCKETSFLVEDLLEPVANLTGKTTTIITGGAIASMLQNEKVNDWDVYFHNEEVVRKVMKAYAPVVTEALGREVKVIEIEVANPYWNKYSDKTVPMTKKQFKFSTESFGTIKENIKTNHLGIKYVSDTSISFYNGVQFIFGFYGSPKEIHKSFDFLHATNYYYQEELHLDPEKVMWAIEKKLVFNNSLYPLAAMKRAMRKFIPKGYTISTEQLFKVGLMAMSLPFTKEEVLKQLRGIYAEDMELLDDACNEIETNNKFALQNVLQILDTTDTHK